MTKKVVLLLVAVTLILLPSILTAQAPDTVWTRRYNGPANWDDIGFDCVGDSYGNLYVTGCSYGNSTGYDYLTIKYNAVGDTLWTRRYNSPTNFNDYAYGCAVDGDGNIYVTGSSYNNNSYYGGTVEDYLTIKYSASGDTLWTRRYNGPSNEDDYAYGCAVDDAGNLYVTGISEMDCLTIKYNSSGDTLWARRYISSVNVPTYGRGCALDGLGNLYVVGHSHNGSTSEDYLTIKYNAAGDILGIRWYNSPSNCDDYAYGCSVDSAGNLYVTGSSYNNGTGDDYLTIKYNAAGDTLWTRRYNGPAEYDYAHDCTVDSFGNIYVTGESYNSSASYDCLSIKYNTFGDTLWTNRYNGPAVSAYDCAHGCIVDNLGNLYVAGSSYISTSFDYLTIKYNTATGVAGKPELPINVSKLKLEQNKPNPFSQHTAISYQLPASGPASLNIYNAAGQLVKTFDMGQQQAGHHQVEWSDSNISAGVYFYRLTAGNYQATKKLVVLK